MTELQDKMLALCLLENPPDPDGRTKPLYFLDPNGKFGLRVKCHEPGHRFASICQGRGWIPEPWLDCLLALGFQPRLCSHNGRQTVSLYQGTPIPWGDGGEGDTWLEAIVNALEKVCAL